MRIRSYWQIVLLLLFFVAENSFAAYPGILPATASSETQWVFNHANACLLADNLHHVNANGECIAIQTYFANNQLPAKNPKLLIFIHGDGIPGGGPSDYLKFQATKFINANTVAVVLIRPGYYDSYGNYSTGESYAFAANGFPGDAYPPQTVATLAAVIQQLKNYYHPSCTILVGHSGGAIMSGIILGKYPGLANGAVLASVTDDIHELAKRHGWAPWTNSLSPHDWVGKIPKNNFVYIISGSNDDDTYPDLAEKYYSSLQQQKVEAYFISVKDGTHNSIVMDNADAFDNAIKAALAKCS